MHPGMYRCSYSSLHGLKWLYRRCRLDKRWLAPLRTHVVVWFDHIMFESGPFWPASQETDGVLLFADLQLKPACVCESVYASVRLSSWTISQIWDLCLMSSWEEQREPAEHHMTLTSWDAARETERVTARYGQRQAVIFSLGSSFYFSCQFVCLFRAHKWLLNIKMERDGKGDVYSSLVIA